MEESSARQAPDPLTRRELELLKLVAEGLSNQDIATKMFITVGTVKWYLNQIYVKLQVGNRIQAIATARSTGILSLTSTATKPISLLSPNNLPQVLTPFVGRITELAELAHLLAEPTVRLITILGPGGIGKTRLALEAGAAQVQMGQFRDGIHFATLAPLSDPDLVASVIADVFHLSLAPGQSRRQQLLNFLRDKEMLLVLDNIEHLLEGIGLLDDLLQTAPQLKILVTSRERLQLQAEVVFRLEGFPFQDWKTLEEATASDAGRFFLQIARRAQPSFELKLATFKDLNIICRLVNGIPLGLLLAAAWMDTLSISEIRQEIQHSFEFLEGELRDLPVRQRSLRAVFEESWRLLNPAERVAMRRLSVFRGGFTREAAEKVGGISLRTLVNLSNKSLISRVPSGRFEVHELLRQFSASELDRHPDERNLAQELHAAYYADFMDSRWGSLRSERMNPTINEIKGDIDNIRSAWKFSVEEGRFELLAKMAPVLWWFLDVRSQIEEGIGLFEQAITPLRRLPAGEARDIILGELLLDLASFITLNGSALKGKALAEESLQFVQDYNVPEIKVRALIPLCLAEFLLGEYQELKRRAEEGIELLAQVGDPWYWYIPLFYKGLADMGMGNYEKAYRAGNVALGYAEESKDPNLLGGCHGLLLARSAFRMGQYEEAKSHYLRSISFFESIGHQYYTALITGELSEVCTLTGDYEAAKGAYQMSLTYFSRVGPLFLILSNLRAAARLLEMQGEYIKAVEVLTFVKDHPGAFALDVELAQVALARIRINLSAENFTRACERGKVPKLDEVIAALLGVGDTGFTWQPLLT
jgi:predicted ATPase/DNA-binding CsgD family transcriptional regulator/tetratricopeptide (TPR) repeat protein